MLGGWDDSWQIRPLFSGNSVSLVVFKSLVMHVTEEELGASRCVLGSPLESGHGGGSGFRVCVTSWLRFPLCDLGQVTSPL